MTNITNNVKLTLNSVLRLSKQNFFWTSYLKRGCFSRNIKSIRRNYPFLFR